MTESNSERGSGDYISDTRLGLEDQSRQGDARCHAFHESLFKISIFKTFKNLFKNPIFADIGIAVLWKDFKSPLNYSSFFIFFLSLLAKLTPSSQTQIIFA